MITRGEGKVRWGPAAEPVGQRTALTNQMRSLLLERGITVPPGRRKLQEQLARLFVEEVASVSARIRQLVADRSSGGRWTSGSPHSTTSSPPWPAPIRPPGAWRRSRGSAC